MAVLIRLLLVIPVTGLFVSCAQAPVREPGAWIVSAGLDYLNSDVPTLNGTVDDAAEVAMCLKSIYEAKGIRVGITLMTASGQDCDTSDPLYPTAENILARLWEIKPGPQDIFVFYWSGHGDVDEKGLFLAAAATQGLSYSKLYTQDIIDVVRSMGCPAVLLVDSCYSGATLTQDGRIAVIASCRAQERSVMTHVRTEEGIVEGHSLFTSVLLECLGWVHGTENQGNLGAVPVYGRLARVPDRTSVQELADQIRKRIPESIQSPVFDRTDLPVLIVP